MRDQKNVMRGSGAAAPVQAGGGSESEALPTAEQVAAAVGAFTMLADPTRLQLLWLLSRGECDVGTLARLVGTSPGAASQHLAKLRLAGLVSVRGEGRRHVYGVRDAHVRRLIAEALFHADHAVAGHPDHE